MEEPETRDLSDAIARIQVALTCLKIEFDHPRVQTWLNRAGQQYAERLAEEGLLCLSPPPYKRLADVPNPLIVPLARVLWRATDEQKCRVEKEAG
ncbi:MAG: hypothetical protein AAFX78_01880 [Cyanobacteria bacterium J06638_20]